MNEFVTLICVMNLLLALVLVVGVLKVIPLLKSTKETLDEIRKLISDDVRPAMGNIQARVTDLGVVMRSLPLGVGKKVQKTAPPLAVSDVQGGNGISALAPAPPKSSLELETAPTGERFGFIKSLVKRRNGKQGLD